MYKALRWLGILDTSVRSYNRGASDYSQHIIQPWSIWLDYNLNPWDADIVRRILRTKEGDSRRLDYEKTLFKIPQESRQKIAKHIKSICEDAFCYYFGEHMLNMNEIERLKHKQERLLRQFIIWTVLGWLLAIVMLIAVIFAVNNSSLFT